LGKRELQGGEKDMRLEIIWTMAVLAGLTTASGNSIGWSSTLTAMKPSAAATSVAQRPTKVTLPAGTRILVRTIDSLDSKNTKTGGRFTATLETSLKANNVVVAQRGTKVIGRVASAKSAG